MQGLKRQSLNNAHTEGLQLQEPWEEGVRTEHSFQTVTQVSERTFSRWGEHQKKARGAECKQTKSVCQGENILNPTLS